MGRKARTPGKCLVCGDNACGINYNVASCMSCKTFFRRNALKQKEAICQFSDCCTLDRITRKFCTKCRLKKCLEVGMNKEMIKTEDEKRKLEEKIRLNKIKRLEDPKKLKTKSKTISPVVKSNVTTNLAPSTSKTLSIEGTLVVEESMELTGSLKPNKEPEINIDEMLDSYEIRSKLDDICPYLKDIHSVKLSDIDVLPLDSEQQSESNQLVTSMSSNSQSEVNLRPNPTKSPIKVLAINSEEMLESDEISSTFDDICPYIKDKGPVELSDIEVIPLDSLERFDKCPAIGMEKELESHIRGKIKRSKAKTFILSIDRISLISNECTLNLKMYEQSRLQEIYRAALAFPDENSCQIIGQVDSVSQLANLPAANMKHIVRFCKNMAEFSCLSKDEQVLVLKCFVPEIHPIRAAFLYDIKTNGWATLEHSDSDTRAVFVKIDFFKSWAVKKCNFFSKFIFEFHREMENDPAIRDLILVQSFFKHFPKKGPNFEFVRYNNVVYHYLLRRYLEHKYLDPSRAAQKYTSLMGLLTKMDIITNFARGFYASSLVTTHTTPVVQEEIVPVLKEIYDLQQT